MKALRYLVLALLVLTLAVYLVAVIVPAVTFYRSAQRAERAELEALDAPLNKLGEVLKDKGTLSGFDDIINEKSKEIQADIADIRQAKDKQVVVSRLESISASLNFIETRLGRERDKGGEAVKDLETQVAALKTQVGPADSWDRLLGTALERGGAVLLTIIWPLGILGFLFYVLSAEGPTKRLKVLFQGVKSVEAGATGIKLDFSGGEEAKTKTEEAFASFREAAKKTYRWWVDKRSIRNKMERVLEAVSKYFTDNGKQLPEYRCTLHVPDIVFADTIYQLIDYLPVGTTGGGRRFSVRFGLIGKVWRQLKPETRGNVPKAGTEVDKLIQEWSMTKAEAERAGRERPSFLCVPLEDEKEGPVGMFYMDSMQEDAFKTSKPDADLHDLIVRECKAKGLTETLAKMKEELSGNAPLIRIYER
jgi:uncharacterized membrane protein